MDTEGGKSSVEAALGAGAALAGGSVWALLPSRTEILAERLHDFGWLYTSIAL